MAHFLFSFQKLRAVKRRLLLQPLQLKSHENFKNSQTIPMKNQYCKHLYKTDIFVS